MENCCIAPILRPVPAGSRAAENPLVAHLRKRFALRGLLGIRRRGWILQPFRNIQFDCAVARLKILNRRGQMNAEALGRIVGKYDTIIKLERLVQNVTEKIRVHPKVHDDLVGRLRDTANIGVACFEARCIDHWRGRFVRFAHNVEREERQKYWTSKGAANIFCRGALGRV